MTHTQVVLELWREAERVLDDLDPRVSGADRSALETEVEEIRILYQRAMDQYLHDEEDAEGHGGVPGGPSLGVAIETARQRLRETIERLGPTVHGGVRGDTRLPR